MNIMKKYICLATAALAFAACTNDSETSMPDNDGAVAIEVNAAIRGTQTRASGDEWATNDRIGISTVASTATVYNNVPYEYDGEKFNPAPDAIYFQSPETVTFNAYYPYRENATYADVSTGAAMQTAAEQPKIDFLYAGGATASKDSPVVAFTGEHGFTHRMAQISIEFKEGADVDLDGLLTGYTLSGLTLSGTFNTETGEAAAATSTPIDVPLLAIVLSGVTTSAGKYTTSPVIIFPQNATQIGLAVTVKNTIADADADAQTYRATLTVPSIQGTGTTLTGLQSGYSYLFPVTVNKTDLEVGTAEIKDWEPVTADGADATM